MKKLILACLFACLVQVTFAGSPLNLGLKAGYNSSKLKTNLDQFNDGSISNFVVGAFARVNISKFYVQPEAYFTSKGGKFDDIQNDVSSSIDYNTIDVPIMAGFKLIDVASFNLRVNAGPVFSFVTSKDDVQYEDFQEQVKDSYAGIQYGLGADFLFLTLDARMENSFGSVYEGDEKLKNRMFLVTLGIKFL